MTRLIRSRRLRLLVGFVVFTTTTLITGVGAQQSGTVMVGSRRVQVTRMGVGSPTIVLESGLATGAEYWNGLVPDLARLSRVIAYSRAGLGESDRGESPRTPQRIVEELHQLLAALGERGPIILVGHSLGGLFARLYVSSYQSDVAGLVIVDGTHEALWQRWQAANPALVLADSVRHSLTLAPVSVRDEAELFVRVETAGRIEGLRDLPDLPIAVLTAMAPCPKVSWSCRDPQALRIKRESAAEWFNRSSNGMHVVSTRTTHDFVQDEPGLVVDAVRFVLQRAR